jgi:energy-converting hydrogenase Eha subunit A
MLTDFSIEYSQRSDDELLHLATQRHSLTMEAAAALDAELHRRNLPESDRVEHQEFAKRQERRELRARRRKIFGKRQFSWVELLSAFVAMAVIASAYLALPTRYHMKPDWEETAVCVMIPVVVVAVGWRSLWRDITFWIALILSSAIQLAIVHAWVQRTEN